MILVCGEALIDFLPVKTVAGDDGYRPVVGGSPFNTAIGIGRLDGDVGFCAALSTDFFGEALSAALARSRVSRHYVARSKHSSMLAFVSVGDGEPEYAFIDEASSNRLFLPERDAPPLGPEVSMIWTGSVALINDPIASAYEKLYFDNKGIRVLGIDPNARHTAVSDATAYRARMKRMTEAADIIKVSKADLLWLFPGMDPSAWARDVVDRGAHLVLLTDGENGAEGFGKGFAVKSPVVMVAKVADTVGAGDSYSSSLLTFLQRHNTVSVGTLENINEKLTQEAMDYAARAAAITVSREGADPPWNYEMA
jgi:fructokinase